MTDSEKLARALAALRRIHKLATPGSLIHEIAAKVVNRR